MSFDNLVEENWKKEWELLKCSATQVGGMIGFESNKDIIFIENLITTTAQRVREETLKEAKEKEAYEWFDAWFSHYKAPLTDKSVQNFGKWATERLQTLGYERQQPEEPLPTPNK